MITRSGTGARFDCHLPDGWRPRASVSRAAWFTCAEALANATKHAPGAEVDISARLLGDRLVLVVRDDGPGGADVGGHGLGGLVERAAALGGTLTARSPAVGGSELELRLPVGSTRATEALEGRTLEVNAGRSSAGRSGVGPRGTTPEREPRVVPAALRVPTTSA